MATLSEIKNQDKGEIDTNSEVQYIIDFNRKRALRDFQEVVVGQRIFVDFIWCEGLGLYVAAGGSSGSSTYSASLYYSYDALTWYDCIVVDNEWSGVCYSPELKLFVAVGKEGTSKTCHSIDGINWTLGSVNESEFTRLNSVCWNQARQRFVAVGASLPAFSDKISMSSSDGINWLEFSSPLGYTLSKVIADGDQCIALSASNSQVISFSGINLHVLNYNNIPSVGNTIATDGQGTVIVGSTSGSLYHSINQGSSWSTIPTPLPTSGDTLRCATWSEGLKVFTIITDDDMFTSDEGVRWRRSGWTTTPNFWNCVWNGTARRLIFMATQGVIRWSDVYDNTK